MSSLDFTLGHTYTCTWCIYISDGYTLIENLFWLHNHYCVCVCICVCVSGCLKYFLLFFFFLHISISVRISYAIYRSNVKVSENEAAIMSHYRISTEVPTGDEYELLFGDICVTDASLYMPQVNYMHWARVLWDLTARIWKTSSTYYQTWLTIAYRSYRLRLHIIKDLTSTKQRRNTYL